MIPENFYRRRQMPLYTEETLPEMLTTWDYAPAGTVVKITVLTGGVHYETRHDGTDATHTEQFLTAWESITIPALQWYRIMPTEAPLQLLVEHHEAKSPHLVMRERAFNMLFPEKNPHFEVKYLTTLIPDIAGKRALDIGSGLGRNTLWLAKSGCSVDCWDKNASGLEETVALARRARLSVSPTHCDLNHMSVTQMYDIIISTVCLQFLQPESARRLWKSAQDHTASGGYHLLIAPVASEDIVCPFDFSYLPPYEEYLGLYDGWEVLLADNAIGQFHKKDANGQRVRARFATIIARKP